MSNSTWLSMIFGPYFVIMGLWMLLCGDHAKHILEMIRKSATAIYFLGVTNLLIGLVILSEYNMWTMQLAVLVTILGWIMIIRGIVLLFAPKYKVKMMASLEKSLTTWSLVPLIYGLLLCWVGFFS